MTIRNEPERNETQRLQYSLQQVIERLEALEGKQAPAESEPVVDTSWPQKGDKYWAVDEKFECIEFVWIDLSQERAALARGNVFRTREEAEEADLLDVAMHELKVMSEKEWEKDGQRLVLSNFSQRKWYCYHDSPFDGWLSYFTTDQTNPHLRAFYFPTEQSALAAYETVDVKYEGILR